MLFDNFFLTLAGESLVNGLLAGDTLVWTKVEGSSDTATSSTTAFSSVVLRGSVVSVRRTTSGTVNLSCSLDNTASDLVSGDCVSIGIYGHKEGDTADVIIAVATVGEQTPTFIPAFDGTVERKAIVLLNAAIELSDDVITSVELVLPNVYALASDLQDEIEAREQLGESVVKLSGHQIISGTKWFNDYVRFGNDIEIGGTLKTTHITSDDQCSPIVFGSSDSAINEEIVVFKAPARFEDDLNASRADVDTISVQGFRMVSEGVDVVAMSGDQMSDEAVLSTDMSELKLGTADAVVSISNSDSALRGADMRLGTTAVPWKAVHTEKITLQEMTISNKDVGVETLLFENNNKITVPLGMPFLAAFVFKDASTALDYTITAAAGATLRLRSDAIEIGGEEISSEDLKARHANINAEYSGAGLDYPVRIANACFDFSSTSSMIKGLDLGTYQLLSGLSMGAGKQQGVALVFRIA